MKVYKITPEPGFNPCIEKDIKDIEVWLENAELESKFTIDVLEMSEEKYKKLPEYMGP